MLNDIGYSTDYEIIDNIVYNKVPDIALGTNDEVNGA